MIHNLLKDKKVILASASPRRKYIFQQIGIKALQMPANIPETHTTKNPRILVQNWAKSKAINIAKKVDEDCVIIAADTIVYFEKEILGKPLSESQAVEYLTKLSGKSHYVYTGIAIWYKKELISNYTKSCVTFSEISENDIKE